MEYILHKKSNCKRIKIRVVKGVVCVSAPLNVPKREIDDFVKEQSAWIENQLSKYTLSKENDLISLLGKKYRLHYIDQRVCYVKGDDLYLYPDQTLIQKFLKQNTKKYIDLRFESFANNYIYTIFLYNMAFIKVSGAVVHLVNIRFVSM